MATAESLKDAYMPPVPPVSGVNIRELGSDKASQIQHVVGKGKDIAKEELAAHTLLKISFPASKSTSSKYIFKKRSPTSSSAKISSDNAPSPSLGQPAKSSNSETDTSSAPKGDESNFATQDVTSHQLVQDKPVESVPPVDPLDDEFVSTAYPDLQGNLKLKTDDPKLAVEPDSSTGTLASYKNLDTFGDQFLVDKPDDAEGDKFGDERGEVVSMVDVPIEQDNSTIPTRSAPTPTAGPDNNDTLQAANTQEKPTASAAPATTEKKLDLDTLAGMTADIVQDNLTIHEKLDKHASLLQTLVNLNLPKTITNHGSRLYKLEHLDLERQVSQVINEQVAEAVSIALEAPLRSRFKDLPINDMKIILQHSMYQQGQHIGHDAHVKLYNALEASIQQDDVEEHARDMEIERKRKQRRQGHPRPPSGSPPQPPPPPPPAGASGPLGTPSLPGGSHAPSRPSQPTSSPSQKHQTDKSTKSAPSKQAKQVKYAAWTTIDAGATSIASHVHDDLVFNEAFIAPQHTNSSDDDEDDASTTHIPGRQWWKSFTRSDSNDPPHVLLTKANKETWWKPDDNQPQSPEPDWTIPSSDLPTNDNNWINAITTSFVPPSEDSLLSQTGDMGTFITWFCKKRGLSRLTQKDLEGPAFNIVKAFHQDVNHLQYQMEECHKMFNDIVDEEIMKYNYNNPLPLGGPPGNVTIQAEFFFNKDLEYLKLGSRQCKSALSITKMKAALYSDIGLEQLVPDSMWSTQECDYDISASLGISHWWLKKQKFYIDRFQAQGDRKSVRSPLQIISVVKV